MTKRIEEVNEETIAEALPRFHGNLSAVADYLRVSRSTVYRRIAESEKLQGLVADQREATLDDLEEELFSQALNGNTTALIFALKTQGFQRAYGDRTKLELEGRLATRKEELTARQEAARIAAVLAELDAMAGEVPDSEELVRKPDSEEK